MVLAVSHSFPLPFFTPAACGKRRVAGLFAHSYEMQKAWTTERGRLIREYLVRIRAGDYKEKTMELVMRRDKIDTSQIHFGRTMEHETVMFLFSMLDGDAEETFGLKPGALRFVGNGPVPIELTLFVK